MKKLIIISLTSITCLQVFAQEKKYDANGYEIGKAPATSIQTQSISSNQNNNLDANGMDKSIKVLAPQNNAQNPELKENQFYDADGRPSNTKVESITYQAKELPAVSNDSKDYRSKGDIQSNNPVVENYTRKTSVDIPANTINGTKENYQRPAGSKAEVQTIDIPENANLQVIPEADKKLSDAELNKKYPNRNLNESSTAAPVVRNPNQISDAELQKTFLQNHPVQNTPIARDKDTISDAERLKLKVK